MGSCTSKEVKEGKTGQLQEEAWADAAACSELLELRCTFPVECKLQAHDLQTVLEVLQMVASVMALPAKAAVLLQMQFAEAVVAHHSTMREAGMCDQAEFSVLGEDEARAQLKEQAEAVSIHQAAEQGDIDDVRFVASFAPKRVNAKDNVTSPCAYELLLNVLDGQGACTPLHWAAQVGHCEVAQVLLAAGADAGAKNQNGRTPLHEAAEYNRCEVADVLLAAGADVNAKNQFFDTPLHLAAYCNHCEVCEVLLAAGADANAKDAHRKTPLTVSIDYSHTKIAKLLKDAGGILRPY